MVLIVFFGVTSKGVNSVTKNFMKKIYFVSDISCCYSKITN